MNATRVGVDLGKRVFHVHAVDRAEKPVWRRKLSRERWIESLAEQVQAGGEVGMGPAPGRTIGPESCGLAGTG